MNSGLSPLRDTGRSEASGNIFNIHTSTRLVMNYPTSRSSNMHNKIRKFVQLFQKTYHRVRHLDLLNNETFILIFADVVYRQRQQMKNNFSVFCGHYL